MSARTSPLSRLLGVVVLGMVLLGNLAPAVSFAEGPNSAPAGVTASDPRSSQSQSPAAFSMPWTPPAPAFRIRVDSDGLYVLTHTALSTAGIPVGTLDPRSFRMYFMGQEIPIRVTGESDGVFDAADVVLFYGRNVDSLFLDNLLPTNKYTANTYYWLTYGCASGPCGGPYGARMAESDGSGSGSTPPPFLHRERQWRQRNYLSAYPFEHDADHWFSDQLTSFSNLNATFTAANVATDPSLNATLTVRLLGYGTSQPQHHLRVWVNPDFPTVGSKPAIIDGSPGWVGFSLYETTVQFPNTYIKEGLNTVRQRLVTTSGSDFAYPDWYDLSYYDTYVAENNALEFNNASGGTWRYEVSNFATSDVEVYDISNPFVPQRFINTTVSPAGLTYTASFGDNAAGAKKYLALTAAARKSGAVIEPVTFLSSTYRPNDLLDIANAADYILITHRNFWAEAGKLAAYRAYDFHVAVVDVQQIYDQFNGGMMSAESIRDFLAYAHANWRGLTGTEPAPQYVLLMGDGNNDMRGYRSTPNTWIPPYLYLADPDLGETAADNRFVTFLGADNVPDMHIGRFPVNNIAEAQAMVDKTAHYEISCQCDGVWNKNTLFLSDDLEGGGGNFYFYSDEIADGYVDQAMTTKLIPESYTVQKEYLGVTCDVVGNPADAAQCRGNTVNTLNTTGALFVSYVGHATKEVWAAESMFNKVAVSQLTNGPCLPIMLPMTCYEGSFHDYQTPETLAEAVVRKPVSGAVASFSPTGFGLVTGHDYLERALMLAWFHEGINRLGAATTYAKQYLANNSNGQYLDLLDTFGLLGDPALMVKTEEVCLTPTGVIIEGFDAASSSGGVKITWQTADESEILGFNVLRNRTPGRDAEPNGTGEFVVINEEVIIANELGMPKGSRYSFFDAAAEFGRMYQYKLEVLKLDGKSEELGLAESGLVGLQFARPHVDQ